MLSEEEIKYIKKSLISKLKFLRYMAYAMTLFFLFLCAIPAAFYELKNGNIINAILAILACTLYPATFGLAFWALIEFVTGNHLFKFIKGKYAVTKEILHEKYKEISHIDFDRPYKRHYVNYCNTNGHTKVMFADENSYINAEIGCTVIVIQFVKDKSDMLAFALPNKSLQSKNVRDNEF